MTSQPGPPFVFYCPAWLVATREVILVYFNMKLDYAHFQQFLLKKVYGSSPHQGMLPPSPATVFSPRQT